MTDIGGLKKGMYKVILVDDEPLVKVALKTLIDWEAEGYTICETASNGKEALKLIQEYQPHIVITDLKMPEMDGLALIRKIVEEHYKCQILVLSNYSDYDNVREALKLGAQDYLLKINLQPDELLHQLKQCTEKISLVSQNTEHKLFYSVLWRELFFDQGITDKTAQYMDSIHDFYVIYLQWKNNDLRKNEPPISVIYIQEILSEILSSIRKDSFVTLKENTILIVLLQQKLQQDNITVELLSKRIYNYLERFFQIDSFLLFSNLIPDCTAAKKYFNLLKIDSSFVYYSPSYCGMAKNGRIQHYLNHINYHEFSQKLIPYYEAKQFDAVAKEYTDFLSHCQKNLVHPELVKKYLGKVLNYMEIFLLDVPDHLTIQTETRIMESQNFFELEKILTDYLKTIQEALQGEWHTYRKETIACINFLMENYRKKLTLSDIASQVSLTEKYLCHIFKADTGVSIIQYLNQLKMDYAAELLKDSSKRVKEVAEIVGIPDQFYFNRIFKKYYGVSPTVYQKENGRF